MKGSGTRKRALYGALLFMLLGGAAPARAAVALQSAADGTTRNWRPEEGNIVVGGHGRTWWTASGEAWELSLQGAWGRAPEMDLPVPVADVRLLSESVLLTVDNDVWHIAEGRWVRGDRFPR
ncbi:MAG: hypothetical protein ABIH26_02805 [Candidatus Eisenbacteria bacterium]